MSEEPEKKAGKKAKKQKKEKKRGSFKTTFFLIIISLVMIIFMQMSFVLFIVGTLPSFVAYYVDTSSSRSLFHTVFACNLSGVLPFIVELLAGGNQIGAMQIMLSDLEVLLVMYISAAVGWGLVYGSPHIARVIINGINDSKITKLKGTQERLLKEWGNDITQPMQ